jgi:hypothetical protein
MLEEHLGYIADRTRLDRFRAAIAEVLRSGDRVADLGCGSGILGLLCLQAGASHVYAIESSNVAEVARRTLTRSGYGDRATIVRNLSQRVELPERVDLLICDHVGFFGVDYGILQLLRDARRRFLKTDGRMIPARLRLWIAAVESTAGHEMAERWGSQAIVPDFRWLREGAVNSRHAIELSQVDVASTPAQICDIDLAADHPDFFSWRTELRIERDCVIHGLGGWFDCALAPDIWMTNSPLAGAPIKRSQAFLPIDEPVAAKEGDRVLVHIMARPADNLLAWSLDFPAVGRRFDQSTWQALLLAPEDLMRSRPERVPRPSREGRAHGIVLGYCDGLRTAREIEHAVLRDHPALMATPEATATFVAQVLSRDTE